MTNRQTMCDTGLTAEIGELRLRYRREHEAIRTLIPKASEIVGTLRDVVARANACGLDWPDVPPFDPPVPDPLPPVALPPPTEGATLDAAIETETRRDAEAGRRAHVNILEHRIDRPFDCDPPTLAEAIDAVGCFERDDMTMAELRQRVQAAIDEAEGLRSMICEVAALVEAYTVQIVQTGCTRLPPKPWFTSRDWHAAWAVLDPKRLAVPPTGFHDVKSNFERNEASLKVGDRKAEADLAQRCVNKAVHLTRKPLKDLLVAVYRALAGSAHLTVQEYTALMEELGAPDPDGGALPPDIRLTGVASTLQGIADELPLLRAASRTPPRLVLSYLCRLANQ